MNRSFIFGLFLVYGLAAHGQYIVSAKAGMINATVGEVLLEGRPLARTSGKSKTVMARFPQMKDEQTLQTVRGRAEVLLNPSAFLRLDTITSVRLDRTKLDDTHLTVERGMVLVEIADRGKFRPISLHWAWKVVEFTRVGLYLFDGSRGVLRVYGGEADVRLNDKIVKAKRGAVVNLADDLAVSKFDPKEHDAFVDWAAARSFQLYDNTDGYKHGTNWQYVNGGMLWNEDFAKGFFSPGAGVYFDARRASEHDQVKDMEKERREAEAAIAAQLRDSQAQSNQNQPRVNQSQR